MEAVDQDESKLLLPKTRKSNSSREKKDMKVEGLKKALHNSERVNHFLFNKTTSSRINRASFFFALFSLWCFVLSFSSRKVLIPGANLWIEIMGRLVYDFNTDHLQMYSTEVGKMTPALWDSLDYYNCLDEVNNTTDTNTTVFPECSVMSSINPNSIKFPWDCNSPAWWKLDLIRAPSDQWSSSFPMDAFNFTCPHKVIEKLERNQSIVDTSCTAPIKENEQYQEFLSACKNIALYRFPVFVLEIIEWQARIEGIIFSSLLLLTAPIGAAIHVARKSGADNNIYISSHHLNTILNLTQKSNLETDSSVNEKELISSDLKTDTRITHKLTLFGNAIQLPIESITPLKALISSTEPRSV